MNIFFTNKHLLNFWEQVPERQKKYRITVLLFHFWKFALAIFSGTSQAINHKLPS